MGKDKECNWSQCNDTDVYSTNCGGMWEFSEGGPKENHAKYCPYCGKQIKVDNVEVPE